MLDDYLREQAAKYRQLAKTAEDASCKQEFLELRAVFGYHEMLV